MFIKTPRSKINISSGKLVHGVGINDADYNTRIIVNGKAVTCPAYRKWTSMLQRCYSSKCHAINPTYIGCSVCNEWLTFSNFALWFGSNNVEGWHLDKDIKIKKNKIYSPNSCLFVPQSINKLLNERTAKRGDWPIGVYFHKRDRIFPAQIRIEGKLVYLGSYITPELAHLAYKKAKNKEIMRKCEEYPQLSKYLINHLLDES